jgi:hypothetical protein
VSTVLVPGFRPSTSGLHFANNFPHVALRTVEVLGIEMPLGDASGGLCGGMAFAARDYFEAGMTPPADRDTPGSGPLFEYLADRLLESLDLPRGPARYFRYMSPATRDHETFLSSLGIGLRGRAWVMIKQEWPKIKADLDSGTPAPLGLVTVKSADPRQLGQNHQVLAWGYELDAADLKIYVYDPNLPDNDDVFISLSTADPKHATAVGYSGTIFGGDHRVWCFFRSGYMPSVPPT